MKVSRSILIRGTSENKAKALTFIGWPFGLEVVYVWPKYHWPTLLEPLYDGHTEINLPERLELMRDI